MANIARRGKYWRVRIRRVGYPDQTRSFDSRANAERWARSVEADIDKVVKNFLRILTIT